MRDSGAIECWGDSVGEVPDGVFTAVSVSRDFACALAVDGQAVCWGDYGRVDAAGGDYVQVAAGAGGGCGLRQSGHIECWGGAGSLSVPGGSFAAVYGGAIHWCALDAVGGLVCWSDLEWRSMPDAPEGEFVEVSAAAVGDGRDPGADYVCGLRASGEIECWAASFGRHDAYRWVLESSGRWEGWEVLTRVEVSADYGQADAPSGRFVAVSAAAEHACGVGVDGRIVCWGNDYHNQLDPVVDRWGWRVNHHHCHYDIGGRDWAVPEGPLDCSVYIRGLDYGVQLSGEAAEKHPHGAHDEFWGVYGGVADPLRGPFVAVSAGGRGACGLRADAALVCWGVSLVGIEALDGAFSQVVVGDHHGCALREAPHSSSSNVVCWGIDDSPPAERYPCRRSPDAGGKCAGPDPEHPQWQQQTEAVAGVYAQLSAGADHTCGLRADSTIACWGANDWGQSDAPQGEYIHISAVADSSCALRHDATPVCWGAIAALRPPPGEFASVIAAGHNGRPCGIRPDGSAECWGYGPYGEPPAWVGPLIDVSASHPVSCGVQTGGAVACWNSHTKSDPHLVAQTSPPEGEFVQVAGSYDSYCAVRVDGSVACTDIGHGTPDDFLDAPEGEFVMVDVGVEHACGIRTGGAVACWGSDGEFTTPEPGP